jgi:hypothetical protein
MQRGGGEEPGQDSVQRTYAIIPYVGLTSGVDVRFDKVYFGIGKNFMSGEHSKQPKYYVRDSVSKKEWYYAPKIETSTTELFHLSAGAFPKENLSVGVHAAIGRIKPEAAGLDLGSKTSFGCGMEASWYFWNNLFIKGSFTYFFGAESFGKYSFYDKGTVTGTTLTYKEDDKISLGSDWKFGLALGYRFNL